MEVFLHAFPVPGATARLAVEAEDEGWDGLLLADSQNLQAEVFIELALAAQATKRLRIGTGVTNPVTRHPAVVAAAAATLQEESGGRMRLGVGRGDSALTLVGKQPAPPERPGLAAKPVIDIDVVARSTDDIASAIERLRELGYEHEGNLGIDGREAFRWPPGTPRHHRCPD